MLKTVDLTELETQFPIKHKILQDSRFEIYPGEDEVPVKKHEAESGAWQQRVELPITVAARANSPRFLSSANEIENPSKVCQTFRLLEQKVQQACQTCQTCRFWNWEINQTQFPSLPSMPFSEVVPVKHIL